MALSHKINLFKLQFLNLYGIPRLVIFQNSLFQLSNKFKEFNENKRLSQLERSAPLLSDDDHMKGDAALKFCS